jgi:phage terminase small subunit
VKASPYLQIINKQSEIMIRAAAELGFTPSSRSRISVDPKDSKTNPFGDL